MVRLDDISDDDLRADLARALAARRGCAVVELPETLDLDEADVVDLLNDLAGEPADPDDRVFDAGE